MRLLDVGCGWGSMAMHAARELRRARWSASRSRRSRPRWPASGSPTPASTDRVEIRLQDYRDLGGETFDAISSIGMFEHVGASRDRRVLRRRCTACSRPAGGCSTTPSPAPAAPRLGAPHVHRPLRVPRRRAASTSARRGRAMRARRLRGARRRVAARALRAARCAPGSPTSRPTGTSAVALGRRGPGPGVAAVHGRLRARLRGRRASACTRCSASSRRRRAQRHAPHPRRLGLTHEPVSAVDRPTRARRAQLPAPPR